MPSRASARVGCRRALLVRLSPDQHQPLSAAVRPARLHELRRNLCIAKLHGGAAFTESRLDRRQRAGLSTSSNHSAPGANDKVRPRRTSRTLICSHVDLDICTEHGSRGMLRFPLSGVIQTGRGEGKVAATASQIKVDVDPSWLAIARRGKRGAPLRMSIVESVLF